MAQLLKQYLMLVFVRWVASKSSSIDVTVRCPHGCRNQRGNSMSALQVAVVAQDGELEKLN
eukprot:5223028-Karenia_brevis.AAC.1